MIKEIFISHSSDDEKKVDILIDSLNGISVQRDRLFHCTRVQDQSGLTQALSDKVEYHLKKADYVLFLLTVNSVMNQWVNQEIGFAQAKEKTKITILEVQQLSKLKGFLHKNLDHPYKYKAHPSKGTENKNFNEAVMKLAVDLAMRDGDIYIKEINESFKRRLKRGAIASFNVHGEEKWIIVDDVAHYINDKETYSYLTKRLKVSSTMQLHDHYFSPPFRIGRQLVYSRNSQIYLSQTEEIIRRNTEGKFASYYDEHGIGIYY